MKKTKFAGKCVIYTRVSTESQSKSGCSLDNQSLLCKCWAKRQEFNVLGVFCDEGSSGVGKTRKGLNQVIAFLKQMIKEKKCIDFVLVTNPEIISRDLLEYLTIRKQLASLGVQIISIDGDISSELSRNLCQDMVVLYADYERKCLGDRIRRGIQAKKERISLENS